MNRIIPIAFLSFLTIGLYAQVQPDSSAQKVDLRNRKLLKADSISNHYLQKADSFSLAKKQRGKLQQKSDSLRQRIVSGQFLKSRKHKNDTATAGKLPPDSSNQKVSRRLNDLKNRKPSALQNKTDSVRSKLSLQELTSGASAKVDSIKRPELISDTSIIAKKKQSIDSLKTSYAQRLDSIKSRVNDPLKLQHKTDSLTKAYNNAIVNKLQGLNKKGIGLTGEEKDFLQKSGMPNLPSANMPELPAGFGMPNLDKKLPGVKMPSSEIKAPEANGIIPSLQPDAQLPNTPQVSTDASVKLPTFPDIPGKERVDELQSKVGELKEVGGKVGEYAADVKQAKEEGLARTKNVDKLAEEGVKNIDEVQAVQEQLGGAEKLKQLQQLELAKIKNAQQLREQASSKLATDKILANEELVHKQIHKMNKHKKKFDNLPDMRYVPKVKPNSMKGKPLKERLVPGALFQILKEENQMSWFIAPELLYKFSGTFSGGVSGMYRFQYSMAPKIIWNNPVYGGKLIAQAKAYKGFYVRTEWENTSRVVPTTIKSTDPSTRVWDANWLAGIGRVQKISPRLNGYFWGFYNITRDPQDLFKNKVILKTGIQFKIVNDYKKVQKHITDKIEKQSKQSRVRMEKEEDQ